ncbi:MarR family winged helix-turn-helix transcriptional regulator [Roseobacter sp. EG26]
MAKIDKPELLDHVGWRLFQAYKHWKMLFTEKMVQRGCPWVAEARGALMQHIGPGGVSQNAIVEKSGLTKQAVQQHLDGLVKDGIIERLPDPKDARKKRVRLTHKGVESQHIANEVKKEIEQNFLTRLGEQKFLTMKEALTEIGEN